MHVSSFFYKHKVSISVIRFILLFFILFGFYGCNSEDIFSDDVVKNKNIKELLSIQILPIKNLSLGVSDLQIVKGSYQAFVAIGFYSDDSSENISDGVFWSSTFSEIAMITEIGIAKGVDVGITSIKAIKDGIISNELSLTVTAAALESIQITPAVVSLAKGNSQQYTAMGFYSDETSRELTQELSWRSRDTSIATISEAGLVVGVGVGNSTITAVKDGVMSNDGRLTVTAAALESIQITPAVVSLAKGNSQQYTAMGFYSDETSRELTQE
ncbi:hypothetical protein GNP61_19215, partial [Aliivibrio fischeri]|uniref:Ig-like domain-containing protein n=1 Tax=Aliivibrio fischeri TaxID=668 RepID=UPI0013A055A1